MRSRRCKLRRLLSVHFIRDFCAYFTYIRGDIDRPCGRTQCPHTNACKELRAHADTHFAKIKGCNLTKMPYNSTDNFVLYILLSMPPSFHIHFPQADPTTVVFPYKLFLTYRAMKNSNLHPFLRPTDYMQTIT